ncbi:MAG TPA: maleylpyruvate isomerase N-terminal domain-containing protein, partial [Aquihabitans sp.]|nr:maleylpyruvate isomerase N-terminal domain-containing protein [Aquihabitans sp.]
MVLDALGPLADRDWTSPAGVLEWTCHQTASHVASDLVRYAVQLAGRTDDAYLRFTVVVPDDEPPAELLRLMSGCGLLLAAAVDCSPADARAWHWGPTDASGFAAVAIGELLVHAYDIAHGLGD